MAAKYFIKSIYLSIYLKDIENHSIYSYKKKLKTYFIQLNYEVDHVNMFRCIDCKHITHCQCYSQ
jgi:hypothetical protein